MNGTLGYEIWDRPRLPRATGLSDNTAQGTRMGCLESVPLPQLCLYPRPANSESPLTNSKLVTRMKDSASFWLYLFSRASPDESSKSSGMIWEWGCGKMCRSSSQGTLDSVSEREPSSPPLGPGSPDQGMPSQWFSLTLCVCLKSMGELGDQFDFGFKTWIS